MTTRLLSLAAALLGGLVAVLVCLSALTANAAGEMTFQVQLLWGTDGEKPKDQPLKEVDPKLQEALKTMFKWKNYYEVTRKPLSIPKDGTKKLKMSEKCEVQVQDLGNARIEIRLYGEGVLVVKQVQTVKPGERITLGGHGKDDTAWLVVMTPGK